MCRRSCFVLLFMLFQFTLFADVFYQIDRKEVDFHFGQIISKDEKHVLDQLSESKDLYLWPYESEMKESFEAYLDHHSIAYKKVNRDGKSFPSDHFTSSLWARVTNPKGLANQNLLQLIEWENNKNTFIDVTKRFSPIVFRVEHYEIPLELFDRYIASYANGDILKSLVFHKEGKKYVRWPIHPEDTKYHERLEKKLRKWGVSTEKHYYFYGMLSASRSFFMIDPQTKNFWSFKTGTDHTGGAWKHKPMSKKNVHEARSASDFLHKVVESGLIELKYLVPFYDTIGFMFKNFDQGFSVREYPGVLSGENYYLPAFTAQHPTEGTNYALSQGAYDRPSITSFWRKTLNIPLARAYAEFFAYTGTTYDSFHTQQYLVELDSHKRPTGRIALRDFGDTYLLKAYYEQLPDASKKWVTDNFSKEDIHTSELWVQFGLFRSIRYAEWMFTEREWSVIKEAGFPKSVKDIAKFEKRYPKLITGKQEEWRDEYFSSFEEMLGAISGINGVHFNHGYRVTLSANSYRTKKYSIKHGSFLSSKWSNYLGVNSGTVVDFWKEFFNKVGCFQGATRTADQTRPCNLVLEETKESIDQFYLSHQ